MNRLLFLFLGLVIYSNTSAQIQKHIKWAYELPSKPAKVGDVVEIKFKGTLDKDWYVYSSNLEVEGPDPTSISFKPSSAFKPVGKIIPVGFHDHDDEIWGKISIAYDKCTFVQKVKILAENPVLEGHIHCQTCSSQCTQNDDDFKLSLQAEKSEKSEKVLSTNSQVPSQDSAISSNRSSEPSQIINPKSEIVNQKPETRNSQLTTHNSPDEPLWSFLLACFLGGLASIFMPCIYPIMPMTVSYFTKQSGGKTKVILYGISIILIYTFFGFLVSLFGGADAANFISTHWLPNLIFFVVFVIFGLSFLGMFEIVLPSSFVNKIDQQADRGGLAGIFFMALTLVVVSFSCTGPIASSLLIEASKGQQVLRPVLGMAFYALPFALVFSGLAMFPSLLKSLPKSGGWLNEFKVVFGMLEFALALKFLSNIDLAYHWNTLDREIFLALWIVIFSLIGFYVLGKIRMDKDSEVKTVGIGRLMLVAATFTFVVYMIPGMFGAPLRALTGWLPPEQTQDFYLNNNGTATASTSSDTRKPHLPLGLTGVFDYEQAIAESKKTGKPIFIDFTGFNCANCRKMEGDVWPDAEVLKRLKNDYVIASLYVDDKSELPQNERYISKYDNKEKTTIGEKNMDLQITKFNNNAQPYYCLVDADGNSLAKPVSVTNVNEFVTFLDEGLKNFKK